MKLLPFVNRLRLGTLALAVSLLALAFNGSAQTATQNQTSAPPVSERVGAAATEATKAVEDTSKRALNKVEALWLRIDQRRLVNRTPDEIVAWALMGLLVGGLLYRVTKLSQVTTIVLGLAGAFLGGILVNVLQLDFGLGPVLIRYEDLIFSLGGGFVLLYVWGLIKKGSSAKPAGDKKEPAK
jgi:uncharacterized membrane protein YeaQ/YmgE (transglycosylase-associated protein family)